MPGVYLSYPFCAQKCTYCNFASGVFPRHLEARYLDALHAEIRAHKWEWKPETLYLGGGTPGSLDPAELHRLLDVLPGRPWPEATIEAAPGAFTPDHVRAWRDCGVNRISLGVQSFVREELARAGRKHSAEIVARDVAMLRDSGLTNINIDLIAGLPGQTPESWQESLAWIERLNPPHVSVYMFEIDSDSRLGAEILRGGARYGAAGVPSEDVVAELYEMAVERLAQLGIFRYEISNFARPGSESRHNLKYWKLEPYAGFGADAHSFDGNHRRRNSESPIEYAECNRVESAPAEADERFFVGLRLTEGIRPSAGEWLRFKTPIDGFRAAGLLETGNGSLRLTSRGVMLSNEVFQEFLTT